MMIIIVFFSLSLKMSWFCLIDIFRYLELPNTKSGVFLFKCSLHTKISFFFRTIASDLHFFLSYVRRHPRVCMLQCFKYSFFFIIYFPVFCLFVFTLLFCLYFFTFWVVHLPSLFSILFGLLYIKSIFSIKVSGITYLNVYLLNNPQMNAYRST